MSKISTTKQRPIGHSRPPWGGPRIPQFARYPYGATIRDIRVREGVTLRELAEALEISNVVMGEVERGASHLDTLEDYQVVVQAIKDIAGSRGER